eukprot:5030441-Amphidinium_carterae.1
MPCDLVVVTDDLNRSKPAANVQYTKKMPDIETLMQVWPGEFEDWAKTNASEPSEPQAAHHRNIMHEMPVPVHFQGFVPLTL